MNKEEEILFHMETKGDDFVINVKGNSGDLVAGFLYCCNKEPSLLNIFSAVAAVINDDEYQNKLNQFSNQNNKA